MTIISELFDDAKFIFKFRKETMKNQKMLDALAPKAGDLAPISPCPIFRERNLSRFLIFVAKNRLRWCLGVLPDRRYVKGTVSIQQLYEQYHEDVQFLNIYIREAHPIDGWWLGRRLTKTIIKKYFPIQRYRWSIMTRKPSKNAGRSPGSVKLRCSMAFIPMSMRWMMMSITPMLPGRLDCI